MESVAGLKSGLGTRTAPGPCGCRVSEGCLQPSALAVPRPPALFARGVVSCKVQPVRLEMPHGSPGPRWPQDNGSLLICSRLKCGGDITANWQ